MKRRLRVWRYEQIYRAYNFYKSEETQDRLSNFKSFFRRSSSDLSTGIVKYRRMALWWKRDENKLLGKSKLRRLFSFRSAMKEGVLDLYMTTMLIVGGITIIYGVYRGRKKDSKKYTY